MRKLIKDSEGNIFIFASVKGAIPQGHVEVPAEELEAAEADITSSKLNSARASKLDEVRAARVPKLARVDLLCNLAILNSWTAGEKTELREYRQALLDITEPYVADASLLDSLDVAAIEWPVEPTEV